MTNQEMQQVLKYIIDKMDPKSQDEIKEILGGDLPDMGEDAMNKGGFAWDRLPSRLKTRAAMAAKHGAMDAKSTAPEFPNAGRLK